MRAAATATAPATATATATASGSFDESGVDTSSSAAVGFPAQVSSLLPEVGALSATGALVEPYLDGYATSNVTTQIGTHAYLPCRVSGNLIISLYLHSYFIICSLAYSYVSSEQFSWIACMFLFVIIGRSCSSTAPTASLCLPINISTIGNTLNFIA